MEISKAFRISGDYKDNQLSHPSWDICLFADVIFIDKTCDSAVPMVYQLTDKNMLENLRFAGTHNSSWKESCLSLGEMIEIDKKKKVLYLKSKQMVTFKHLIIISGKKPLMSTINHEISNALNTLAEALKINPKMDSMILPSSSLRAPKDPNCSTENTPDDRVNEMIQTYFYDADKAKSNVEIEAFSERLYEIYL